MKKSWKVVCVMILKDAVGLVFFLLLLFGLPETAWRQDLLSVVMLGYTVFISANSIDAFICED